MSSSEARPETTYRRRQKAFLEERDHCASRLRRIGQGRLLTFLIGGGLLVWVPETGDAWPYVLAVTVAVFAGFLALVAYQRLVEARCENYQMLADLNAEGLARRQRDWDALPTETPEAPDETAHALAEDLDLFGHGSIFSLLSTVGAPGRQKLAGWLLEPADPQVIGRRQAAVAELAQDVELREAIAINGRKMRRERPASLASFIDWAESEPWLHRRPGLLWSARLLPLVPIALIALNIVGLVSYLTWVLALAGILAFSNQVAGKVHHIFDRAFAREGGFQEYAELIRLVEEADFSAPLLREIQARLAAEETRAHEEMERLHRLVSLSEVRLSMMYVALQALTLWDFHVLDRLEAWQLRSGRRVRNWLTAVAEADALAALATLSFDQPDWAFPEITRDGTAALEARDIGHPLLPDSVRVVNDITVPPPGRFLFITGSNMSGKSTLLRAIGTNVILAQAGGPVCASALRLPPVSLATSMRVHDSLQAGLSHFMAELQRLKAVVEAARRAEDRPLLYLLDDILQGTNSAERQIAARKVVQHLLEENAIGCVTSHDLALADEETLSTACDAVHFTESVEEGSAGPKITFDYRLQPGVATSRNALKLVELVGLGNSNRD